MKSVLLRIYDWLALHRKWMWIAFSAIVVVLIALSATLRYNEDIMDFLPVTAEEREALDEYQSRQSASRIVLIIEGEDAQQCSDALDEIDEKLSEINYFLSTDPTEQLAQVYEQLPYLIPDSIYDRFDSLFTSEAIQTALQRDKAILATPGGSALSVAIQSDPLGLLDLSTLNTSLSTQRTLAFLESPYGGTETKYNASLVDSLKAVTDEVAKEYPDLDIRWNGAPIIAVGNARRIKTDTLLCIGLSAVLILLLLAYAFPRRRDLWLVLLAVSVGWLFGMAMLHLITPSVSVVVLGIGSVLIGIAVNYPLHLLVHQRYTTSVRQTLDEVLSPLVVGNITTVAAFLVLVPMHSVALRHLGIFAASMLVGTILFCIFIMPHLMSAEPTPIREITWPFTKRPAIFQTSFVSWAILLVSLAFGLYLWLVPTERFDANLNHINYMTEQQRADMASFDMMSGDAPRWTDYWASHDPQIVIERIQKEAEIAGFRPEAFTPFYDILTDWKPITPFSMSDLTQRLSNDFDYIGLFCSLIVFLFLWLSFRRFSLALIAFIPMALSWVWILAIMQLCDMHFNIVNIILATFIFGQGDDYTIFVVEGLLYERRTGKAILPQYRQSIILSALIMLLGIGILVFAVHPAMHSLGAVTLIGMFIVLLMAIFIPPFLFKILLPR